MTKNSANKTGLLSPKSCNIIRTLRIGTLSLLYLIFILFYSPSVFGQTSNSGYVTPKATPTIGTSKTTLDFEKVYTGFTSLTQSYTLTGSNLTEAIVISAPSGVEISTSCGSGYTNSISISPSAGSVNTTIYARYSAGVVSGNITHTHTGATTVNITLSETANASNLPGTYYSTATGTGATLKTQLYNIIKGHTKRTYTNLWTDFQTTDRKPDGSVWDMYTDIPCGSSCVMTYTTNQDDGTGGTAECQKYNREHSWPNSWFGGDVGANEGSTAYTDLFHLVPTDKYVNNARGNYIIGEVTAPTKTFVNGGLIGPNNVSGSGYTGTVFEPIDAYKGDFARAYFYMVTRYQPDQAAWEAMTTEGDVIMDGTTYPSIEPWVLTMLLNWNTLDPVDQKEKSRNDAIYTIQGNRNPYIDNPNYVNLVWVTSPTLSSSTSSLTVFNYQFGSGPSANQSFTISGTNLTGSGNITATGSTNYEVSSDGTNFASSVTFPFASGVITSQPKTVYVRLKSGLSAGNYNTENITISGGSATSINVVCSGSVSTVTPTLTASISTLSGFNYLEGSGPSTNQNFTISGTNLTGSGNITATGSTNYEVSSDGTNFASSVTFPFASGVITSQPKTVYVRLKSGLSAGNYNTENITISGGSATSINVVCSGSVSAVTPTLTASISTLSGFNYLEGSGPSTNQNFTISGTNLTGSGNITATGSTNYEVSSDGTNFASSVTFPFASGVITSQPKTVYVRLKSGLSAGNYNTENITISGGSATSINVVCSGSVSAVTPTLTSSISTLSGFNYLEGSGPSTNQSFTISGTNLTGSGNITATGSTNYEVSSDGTNFASSVTFPFASGVITSQPKTVYVRLKSGLSAGNYNTENITISGGSATSINVVCSGSVSAVASSCATDLIISEYIEGNSNNKYIEIYNGTTASINLSDYKLRLFANGSATATNDVTLSGSLASGAVIIYENSGEALSVSGISSAVCNYNGDDAVALYKISTASYVDIIGRIGEDPGTEWISGTISTLNKTLVRKSTIFQGVTTNPVAGFPTLATEWDVYAIDDITHLGSHNMACPSIVTVGSLASFGSQILNSATTEQSYTVSGSNLTSNIIITPPVNFEISTTSGSGFVSNPSTITLTLAKGNITTQIIYVRMKPTTLGALSGNITNASNGATTKNIPVNGTGMSTLPITLNQLFLTCIDQEKIEIHWTTASELNNSHFNVERSTDGKSWQQIAQIAGAGNSSMPINYTSVDNQTSNASMYRLVQVDFDGKSTTYGPISANCNNTNETQISVYPNPFNDHLTIQLLDEETQYSIALFDPTGKLILETKTINSKNFELNTATLAPGVYSLKVRSNGGCEVIKVVKR